MQHKTNRPWNWSLSSELENLGLNIRELQSGYRNKVKQIRYNGLQGPGNPRNLNEGNAIEK